MAFVNEPFNLIYIKSTDSGLRYYLSEISHTELKECLSIAEPLFEVPLKDETKVKDKLYYYILEHRKELTYKRLGLLNENTSNERILNLFHRFAYVGKRNNKLLETYLKHVQEVICNNNSSLYEYVLNMLAFYI